MATILEARPGTALVWNDERVCYADLLRRAWAWSRVLRERDTRVAVFSENRLEWAYAAYGVWAGGRALVPVDHMSSAEETAYVLDDCTPGAVFCSPQTRPVLERALTLARHQPRVLAIDAGHEPGVTEAPPVDVREGDLAAIVYTSGTTGKPKGVMLSFGNLLANVRPVADEGYFTPDRRVLLLLPLHHVLPLAGALMAPLFAGSTIVFATSLAGPELLATLQRNAVTTLIGVPRFYDLLGGALRDRIAASPVGRLLFAAASRIGSRRFSRAVFGSVHRKLGGRLEHLICGGAALSPDTARVFDGLGFMVCEGYGMTECAPMITFPRLGDARLKLGTCGQVLRDCEVCIENGEILARGPNVMLGYYGRPAETAEMVRDGWLHTGDLGRLDDEGYLSVTGRLKEILVLPSGKKVNPLLIEEDLAAVPGVTEAGVYLDGDTLHAVLVPDRAAHASAEGASGEQWVRREVVAPYNARVAPYKRIARVSVVPGELPRTRLGKLKRHELPALAGSASQGLAAAEAPDRAEDAAVTRLAAFLSRNRTVRVHAASRLEADLGLDSLGRVELAVFLERAFGVEVPESALAEVDTVGDVARLVRGEAVASSARGAQPAVGDGGEPSWAELLAPVRPPSLPRSGVLHRMLVYGLRVLVRLYFRTRVQGLERLPEGPCILAPNHQSFFDGLFVIAHMRPRTVLRTLFYAKAMHVERLGLSAVARRSNVVVMRAGENLLHSLQALAAGLRRGDKVMIFPEGTRSQDGSLGAFKESYAILARELSVPVVPVVIDGAHRALPAGRWLPRLLARISVTYLEPIRPSVGESVGSLNRRVRDVIEAQLASGRTRASVG